MAGKNTVSVEVQGYSETLRGLRKFEQAMDSMEQMFRKVGVMVLREARNRMPVSPSHWHEPGLLRSGYYSDIAYSGKRGAVGAKVASKGVPYAGVSEFGGSIPRRGSKGQKDLGHVRGAKSLAARYSYEERVSMFGRTMHKKKAKDVGLDSYYVYPAADKKMRDIEGLYIEQMTALRAKYLPEQNF